MAPPKRPLRAKTDLAVPADVEFPSGSTTCSATLYAGTNGACVVMASGLGVTKGPGTSAFARRFHRQGFGVLAFDYRRFGRSGGSPRQIVRIREQLDDWHRAVDFAAALPGVEPARIAIWGFSLAGGHVLAVAARRDDVAAAIAQAPTADGFAAARNAMRHARPLALTRLTGRAMNDSLRGLVGADPLLVPVAAPRGEVAMLTTPDATDARRALDPDGGHPDWDGRVAARFALSSGSYRPGRYAGRVRCPLLVLAYEDDRSALARPAVRAAEKAPRGELARRPGGHYAGFLEDFDESARIEIAFLRDHLLVDARP